MTDSPSAQLCTSCGLCCDGTIYDNLRLEPGESAEFGTSDRVQESAEGEMLQLPCPLLSGTCCTIYASRPAICRKYRCAQLRAVEDGALPFDAALDNVARAKSLVAEVRRYLAPGQAIDEVRKSWLAWSRGRESDFGEGLKVEDVSKLNLAMMALNLWLDRHFRPSPRQALVQETDLNPPA